MKKVLLGLLCLGATFSVKAQQFEVDEAEKSYALYQTLANAKQPVPLVKQFEKLNEGLAHTDKAIVHKKTIESPKGWAVRALLASTYAYYDSLSKENSDAKLKIAEEAVEKAKTFDVKKEQAQYIKTAEEFIGGTITNSAVKAYNSKNYEAALSGFDKMLKINPNDTALYVNAGVTSQNLKKFDVANGYFKKAISLNAKDSKQLYAMMIDNSLRELKDTVGGMALIEEAVAKYPDDITFIGQQTSIYIDKGEVAKSQASLLKLLEKDPGKPEYNAALADTYFKQAQDLQAKRSQLTKAKKVKEAEALVPKMKGFVDQALPYYQKAVATNPKYLPALEAIKNIYAFKGETKNWEEISKKIKEIEAAQPKQ